MASSTFAQLAEKVHVMAAHLTTVEADLATARDERQAAAHQIAKLEATVQIQDMQINALVSDVSDLQSDVSALQSRLEASPASRNPTSDEESQASSSGKAKGAKSKGKRPWGKGKGKNKGKGNKKASGKES